MHEPVTTLHVIGIRLRLGHRRVATRVAMHMTVCLGDLRGMLNGMELGDLVEHWPAHDARHQHDQHADTEQVDDAARQAEHADEVTMVPGLLSIAKAGAATRGERTPQTTPGVKQPEPRVH